MNRNLDGSELTDQQLFDIAVEGGADPQTLRAAVAGHGENYARSILIEASKQRRYEMFWDGELKLDTRTQRLNGADSG